MSLTQTSVVLATPAVVQMTLPSGAMDREEFWRFAEQAKAATETLAKRKMRVLPQLPVDSLRAFCIQYRFFTIDYISDLALLVAKLPFGGLRSLLSQILAEELGEGGADKAHPALYDRFLLSIGADPVRLEHPLRANRDMLRALTDELTERSAAFGVGLRGMGGECLCQTYLSVMHQQLVEHPHMRAHADAIDWAFWTIHAGEQDIVHGELTRQAIDEYIREDPAALPELAQGYERSITAWNAFWQNIFDACVVDADAARSRGLS